MTKGIKLDVKTIGLIVTLLLISGGVVTTWAVSKERQRVLCKNLRELKVDGCDKSDVNQDDIIVLQTDVKHIRKTVDEIKTAVTKERP